MFGFLKRLAILEKQMSTVSKIGDLEEQRTLLMQKQFDAINARMSRLEEDYRLLRDDVRRCVEKTDKYDASVGQALNLLRKIPGVDK